MPKKLPLIIANWKMNLSIRDSVALAKQLVKEYKKLKADLELVLAPSFPAISAVAETIKRSGLKLGAQDVFWKTTGPYTGEVSPAVLKELGVDYVIIGHSERRQYFSETDNMVQQKVLATLTAGMVPVVCVGETFAQRQIGQKDMLVTRQVNQALQGVTLSRDQKIVIAYEPVWVIGSGQAVEPSEAEHTAKVVNHALLEHFSKKTMEQQTRVIYGGSVDITNIDSFVCDAPPISGVLVGGASLEAKRFISLLAQL